MRCVAHSSDELAAGCAAYSAGLARTGCREICYQIQYHMHRSRPLVRPLERTLELCRYVRPPVLNTTRPKLCGRTVFSNEPCNMFELCACPCSAGKRAAVYWSVLQRRGVLFPGVLLDSRSCPARSKHVFRCEVLMLRRQFWCFADRVGNVIFKKRI